MLRMLLYSRLPCSSHFSFSTSCFFSHASSCAHCTKLCRIYIFIIFKLRNCIALVELRFDCNLNLSQRFLFQARCDSYLYKITKESLCTIARTGCLWYKQSLFALSARRSNSYLYIYCILLGGCQTNHKCKDRIIQFYIYKYIYIYAVD